ncbi:MAG: cytochrome c [Myxococcota bacterium]|nr:cytochrome c [Myxococcota bacterium]
MPRGRLVWTVALCCLVAHVSAAQPPTGSAAGRELYVSYCASCHGLDGRGGGPRAAELMVPPPDLTRLHERYGNPLPRERVAAFIDGRENVEAHGPREMPVWGERFFEGDPGPPRGVESARRRTIDVLVDYLQALQGFEEARLRR